MDGIVRSWLTIGEVSANELVVLTHWNEAEPLVEVARVVTNGFSARQLAQDLEESLVSIVREYQDAVEDGSL